MKMLILLFLCLAFADRVAVAQGTVDFRNGGVSFRGPPADRKVYFPDCTPLVGTNFVAGLYYLPGRDRGPELDNPTSGLLAGALATFRSPGTASPGTWVNPTEVGNNRVLEGFDPNQPYATLQVRVWDITEFATYAEAVAGNGFHTASAPFIHAYAAPPLPPDFWYLNELRAFGCVTEPSTVALLLLAASGLWFVRRR